MLKEIIPNMLCVFAAFSALLLLGGCSYTSRLDQQSMTPMNQVANIVTHDESVRLRVTGGLRGKMLGVEQLSDGNLLQVLTKAIQNSRIFSGIDESSKLLLDVFIVNHSHPYVGNTTVVKVEIGWMLQNTETNKLLWKEVIETAHTASAKDIRHWMKRIDFSAEQAVRENIETALNKLAKLPL